MDMKDEFDDLSFPEIPYSVLVELAGEGSTTTPLQDATVPQQVEKEEQDTVSEDSLWDDIEFAEEDYLSVNLLEPTSTPDRNKQVDPDPSQLAPIVLHFSQSSSASDLGDIEDFKMNPSRNIMTFMERFRRQKSLSVSNLVHPFWCEYKAKYDLIGQKHLGVEKRPMEFEVERKVIENEKEVIKKVPMKIDREIAVASEKQTVIGREVHRKLEKEVIPDQLIYIITHKRVEDYAIKLIYMIERMQGLVEKGKSRELPVLGLIHGIPITGIIDDLRLVTFSPGTSGSSPLPRPVGKNSLFITDFKTVRSARFKYQVSDDYKLQMMLYKHLLDGLLSPTFDWIQLFEANELDSREIFGDEFIAQLSLNYQETNLSNLAKVQNLEDVVIAWKDTVESLKLANGLVETELSIQYRLPGDSSPGPSSNLQSDSNEDTERVRDSTVLATRTFDYDVEFLQHKLNQALDFWLGQRPLKGVPIGETWKCGVCEYKKDCEWRAEQAAVLSQRSPSRPPSSATFS
ncbi:hypothetical protein CPB86DRAFT_781242 [Serendipita vermifera]|nr:hypothetical protein CPB86DRAFT_781242 [Serendipita vermifera]